MTQQMPALGTPPGQQANGGKITDQQRTVEVVGSGQAVPGVRVSFSTGKGLSGSVFIPESQYTQANAIATARAQANLLDALHQASI